MLQFSKFAFVAPHIIMNERTIMFNMTKLLFNAVDSFTPIIINPLIDFKFKYFNKIIKIMEPKLNELSWISFNNISF